MENNNDKNWFVSTSDVDGFEVITKGRRGLQNIIKSGKFNERVEIEWSYEPLANGMPTEEKDKFMNEVAHKLGDALEEKKVAYLTTTYTGRERFFIIFYTCDIEHFAEILHNVLDEYEQLPIQIGRIEDPNWEDYNEMLELNGMIES